MSGANVHIDESAKAWARKITAQEYDLKVLSFREFKKRYGVTRKKYDELLKKLEQ